MTYALSEYFIEEFVLPKYQARPIFPVDDRWSASYNGEGMWLVETYDITGSYAGTWLVPELVFYSRDYDRVAPLDEEARAIKSGLRRIAETPPLPPLLRSVNSPREEMIATIQQHIAIMSRKEAAEVSITEIQQAVQSYYPLEWQITYTDSEWRVEATYGEYKAAVHIDPFTGQMKILGWSIY